MNSRALISPVGCSLLALGLSVALFAVDVADLLAPGLAYPEPGGRTKITYRIPPVGVLLELDERSLYSRGRVEVPVGSRVVGVPAGGEGREAGRFEVPVGSDLSHRDVSFLRALEEHRRPPGLGFSIGLALLLLGLFQVATHTARMFVPGGDRLRVQLALFVPLLLLLAIHKAVLLFTPVPVYWMPLAGLSMTWAVLHSRRAGLMVGLVGAAAAATLVPMDWGLMVTLAAQSMIPPLLMSPAPKRRTLGLPWVAGAVVSLAAYVAFQFVSRGMLPAGDLSQWDRSGLVAVAGAGAISPLLSFALRPVLRPLLGILSRSQMMELADLDHSLLRRLAVEAPGTWQHSLAIANMAEVACNAIGANGNLVRIGAYFHDVGKVSNPTFFGENLESGAPSPHEKIPPEESAKVIFEHVSEGLELARRYKVPAAVREFIMTHHGNSLLEFFWHKYEKEGSRGDLPEAAFHYPGTVPQRPEAAVLSLVDAAEAASKSLKEPDAEQVDDLVRRIIHGKLASGQLDESGLRARDLALITSALRDALRSQFHVRPRYPWQSRRSEAEVAGPEDIPPGEAEVSESVRGRQAPGPEVSGRPERAEAGTREAGGAGTGDTGAPEVGSPAGSVPEVGSPAGSVPEVGSPAGSASEVDREPEGGAAVGLDGVPGDKVIDPVREQDPDAHHPGGDPARGRSQ